jgi:RNA polymerase sigma-70 factor (ECF subfamily)
MARANMNTTRATLLLRIRNPRDTQAWAEFHDLYAPLLYRYARARGLSHEDAEDVQSTCYETIVRQIRQFDYQKEKGGFKAWLRTFVNRRVIDLMRKRREPLADSHELNELPAREPSLDELWEEQWRQQHLLYCVEQVSGDVPEATFQAFQMLVRDHCSVQDVCDRLGLNTNQVYKAKARVVELVRARMAAIDSEVGT